ncbi:hypothetical protein IQ06DRAFT_7191 [Phaeosphaeriaceae sp. SRC1lsM3a]|nr:hypothetical protein IQ06DRAFT_7191 [Stagonospora sp. SRC1lsM3a]
MATAHNIVEYTIVLPTWLITMSILHAFRYIYIGSQSLAKITSTEQYQSPVPSLTSWLNKNISALLSTLRAELDTLLAFFKDHDQNKRLQRAWASFKLWYLPLVFMGVGKASKSCTLRIECAVVMCMIFALAQADKQEREKMKAEVEELNMRLGEGESEDWNFDLRRGSLMERDGA